MVQPRVKTYQAEQLGRTELADWLVKQSPPAQLREELMVRLRVEAQLGGNTVLPELERHLILHKENCRSTKVFLPKTLVMLKKMIVPYIFIR